MSAPASVDVDVDVLIIGAGIAGIDAAYRVQSETKLSYAVVEARNEIGGTWSLFKFSGVRSDIDMIQYGYSFRPWTKDKLIAEGWEIRQYIDDVATEKGIKDKVKFQRRVQSASWSSAEKRWTVTLRCTDPSGGNHEPEVMTSRFIFSCTGYYDDQKGYYPPIKGAQLFKGPLVRPQFWPDNLDYRGKKVVIIGSGATAATLLPSMSRGKDGASSVTLLQRSPSYYFALPSERPIVNVFRRWAPASTDQLMRWWLSTVDFLFFLWCLMFPNAARRLIRFLTARQLPPHIPLDPHFDPKYTPWKERLCMVADGDFFQTLRSGKGHIATGVIDTFTPDGIQLVDGTFLEADVVVQATGLEVRILGGIDYKVDGETVETGKRWLYRGTMLSNVPNLINSNGYFFQAWTLGADISARSFTKLVRHMEKKGYSSATPIPPDGIEQITERFVTSGYIVRASGRFPKVSTKKPWKGRSHMLADWLDLHFANVEEDMRFE